MTVATTVSSASAPRSCSASAQIARIASPSTTLAVGGRRPGSGRRRRRGRCRGRRRVARTASISGPEVGGADAVVDVPAVGLAADRVHRGAGAAVHLGRDRGGGAVRAVDDDACSPVSGRSTVDEQVREVVARPRRAGRGPGRRRRRSGRWSSERPGDDGPLDRGLDGVGQLVAAAAEQLDAVVGHRVVAGRDHDAEVGAVSAGQEGERGRRQRRRRAARRRRRWSARRRPRPRASRRSRGGRGRRPRRDARSRRGRRGHRRRHAPPRGPAPA